MMLRLFIYIMKGLNLNCVSKPFVNLSLHLKLHNLHSTQVENHSLLYIPRNQEYLVKIYFMKIRFFYFASRKLCNVKIDMPCISQALVILIAPKELLNNHFEFSQDRNHICYLNIDVNIKTHEFGIKLNRKLNNGKGEYWSTTAATTKARATKIKLKWLGNLGERHHWPETQTSVERHCQVGDNSSGAGRLDKTSLASLEQLQTRFRCCYGKRCCWVE